MTTVAERNEVGEVIGFEVPIDSEVTEPFDMMDAQGATVLRRRPPAVLADFVALARFLSLRLPIRAIVNPQAALPVIVILAGVQSAKANGPAFSRAAEVARRETGRLHELLAALFALLDRRWGKMLRAPRLSAGLPVPLAHEVNGRPDSPTPAGAETRAGRTRRTELAAALVASDGYSAHRDFALVPRVVLTGTLPRAVLPGPGLQRAHRLTAGTDHRLILSCLAGLVGALRRAMGLGVRRPMTEFALAKGAVSLDCHTVIFTNQAGVSFEDVKCRST
jgi:hypothetical protein